MKFIFHVLAPAFNGILTDYDHFEFGFRVYCITRTKIFNLELSFTRPLFCILDFLASCKVRNNINLLLL